MRDGIKICEVIAKEPSTLLKNLTFDYFSTLPSPLTLKTNPDLTDASGSLPATDLPNPDFGRDSNRTLNSAEG